MTHRPGATPTEQVLRLLGGKMISQAISTAAELGVVDTLARDTMTVPELADRLGCHPRMLSRLMAVLVGEGLFDEDVDGRLTPTALGRELSDERLGPLAAFMGSPGQWAPWSALRQTIRSGGSAFEMTHGASLYQWLEANPEAARQYDRSVDRFTTDQARALAEDYNFGGIDHVVDVGGGRGTMLLEILRRWPHLQGTLFDVPHVIEAARPRFESRSLADRCRFIGGDFFGAIPAGADAYLIKHILHNWDDHDALRILKSCRAAMTTDCRLLVVEGVMPPGPQNSTSRMMDLEMMVLFGRGRERSKLEFKGLFTEAGFRLDKYTAPLGHFARLLTATPR